MSNAGGERGMEAKRKLHDRIRELHAGGATIQEIAARMGLTDGAVRYILKKEVSQKA